MGGMLFASLLAAAALAAPAPVQLTSPFGVVVQPGGALLVADGSSGRIVRIDPRTGARSVFARGLGSVFDLKYGPGGLYAVTATQVVRFAGGTRTTLVRGLKDPFGLAVAPDGTIYVAEQTRDRVLRFDPVTRARSVVAQEGLDQPLGLALLGDRLLVADSHHHRIAAVGEGGTLEPVVEGLALPVNVTVAGGAVYAVDHVEHGRPGRLVRLAPDGTKTVIRTNVRSLSGVAVRGGTLYVSSFEAPFVGRLTAAGTLKPI